jgi:hypothetical protein
MNNYLDPTTDAPKLVFKDMQVKPKKEYLSDRVCPRCQGHGQFNLRINAYGPGKHFKSLCGACWGYGYLQKGQVCAHEWRDATEEEIKKAHITLYRCEHAWVCTKCSTTRVVSSSD